VSGQHRPADALARFMHGIFEFYRDKGMPQKSAKARMFDETLDTCYSLMSKEQEIPDHALVIAAQFLSRLLNSRGVKLTNAVKAQQDPNDARLEAMRQIKAVKDALDQFISIYKGETQHGKK
jgi:hypothetical protein